MASTTIRDVSSPPLDSRTECPPDYCFDIDDSHWLSHLRERGYVVVTNVLSADDVETTKNLIWEDLRGGHGVSREDTSPWSESKWTPPLHGIVPSLAQTAGPWHVRGNENVRRAFAAVWDTSDLITSMDAVILWRSDFPHDTEGLHLDQNPFTKPGLDCVQGMVPLLPVTAEVGGLEVVPCSHTDEARARLCERRPELEYRGDFLLVDGDPSHPAKLLECKAGDLILWDSRTVHGRTVGPGVGSQSHKPQLCRMAVTVAMTPRGKASEEVQELRRTGFQQGMSFNHCPHEAGTSTGTMRGRRKRGYKKFRLTESQLAVL